MTPDDTKLRAAAELLLASATAWLGNTDSEDRDESDMAFWEAQRLVAEFALRTLGSEVTLSSEFGRAAYWFHRTGSPEAT